MLATLGHVLRWERYHAGHHDDQSDFVLRIDSGRAC